MIWRKMILEETKALEKKSKFYFFIFFLNFNEIEDLNGNEG